MVRNKLLALIAFIVLVCILPIKILAVEVELEENDENISEEETINEEEIINQNQEEETNVEIFESKTEEENNEIYYTSHKSENANLDSLQLDVKGLSPQFSRLVTEYSITVDKSVGHINIIAVPEDTDLSIDS